MLKNTFMWLLMVCVALTLAWHVVTRPKTLHVVQTPTAVVVMDGKDMRIVPKPKPAVVETPHVAPAPKPAPKPDEPKAAVSHRHEHEKVQPKVHPKHVQVNPENGGAPVGISCDSVKGYVDRFGRDRVRAGALQYGYSEADVDKTFKTCGL